MEMINGLTSMIAAIEDGTEATSGDSELRGDMLRGLKEILKNVRIFQCDIEHIGNVFFRDDQDMNRRLRTNIAKSEDPLVLENLLRREGALGDFTKNTFFGFLWIVRSHSALYILFQCEEEKRECPLVSSPVTAQSLLGYETLR